MKKEMIISVLVGLFFGLVIVYGVYTAQTSLSKSSPSQEELSVSPTPDSEENTNGNLTLHSPEDEIIVNEPAVTVTGTTLAESYVVVFINDKEHITPTQINRIVAKAGHRAQLNNPIPELKNINPHILRHSCARILKDRGLSLEVVQRVLGHLSFKTTMDLYGTKSISEMDDELKEKAGNLFD